MFLLSKVIDLIIPPTFKPNPEDVVSFDSLSDMRECAFYQQVECFIKINEMKNVAVVIVDPEISMTGAATLFWNTPTIQIYQIIDSSVLVLKIFSRKPFESTVPAPKANSLKSPKSHEKRKKGE